MDRKEGVGWVEGTHPKHFLHACDAGRVELQLPVELLRVLPSRKGEVIRSGMGYWLGGERAVGAVVELAARREAARLEVGLRARTLNISSMLVTLDVAKFSGLLKFVAPCRVARESSGYWPGGERAVGAVVELAARREAARLEVGLRAHAP